MGAPLLVDAQERKSGATAWWPLELVPFRPKVFIKANGPNPKNLSPNPNLQRNSLNIPAESAENIQHGLRFGKTRKEGKRKM
jgi:hypothetical protein